MPYRKRREKKKSLQEDDMWAMGVMLHELLSSDGSLPFLGRPLTMHDFTTHHDDCTGGYGDGRLIFDEKCRACQLTKELEDALGQEVLQVVSEKITAGPEAKLLLGALLCKESATRPNANDVLDGPWLAAAPTPLGELEFAAQPDAACQVLLNVVMWRLCHDAEVNKCFAAFCLFDKDHSGRVKRQCFRDAFRNESSSCVDKVFDTGDVDGNESLDFNEFATLCFNWSAMEAETLGKHIHEFFVDIGNSQGHVNLQQLCVFFGEAVSEGVLQTLFQRMEVDSNAFLTDTVVRDFILQGTSKRTVITWDGCSF